MVNRICHIEFHSTDFDRSQRFYEGLFGWTFRDYSGMDMRVFGHGEDHIGGFIKADSVAPGETPSLWFQVADLDAAMAKAVEVGGSVISGRAEVPGVGFSAQLADPDGNRVGVVEYV